MKLVQTVKVDMTLYMFGIKLSFYSIIALYRRTCPMARKEFHVYIILDVPVAVNSTTGSCVEIPVKSMRVLVFLYCYLSRNCHAPKEQM